MGTFGTRDGTEQSGTDAFRPTFGALKLCGTRVPRNENWLNFGSPSPPWNGASICPILHLQPKIRLCLYASTPPIEQYCIQSFNFYVLKSIHMMSLGSVGLDWVTCFGFSSVGLDFPLLVHGAGISRNWDGFELSIAKNWFAHVVTGGKQWHWDSLPVLVVRW
ncbi:hypothetical protein DVH24_013475 [Malus domestica]|uniref:Uncharacterized protein n=1 Tax=Malus domestica TaxID=3750 RepID=A0A498HIB4_MALDO|nr:hypothetical protein DVH24_013475 [Malus domestica]